MTWDIFLPCAYENNEKKIKFDANYANNSRQIYARIVPQKANTWWSS